MTQVIPITAFACSICKQQHPTPAAAIACHDSHLQPNICTECDETCGGGSCKLLRKG